MDGRLALFAIVLRLVVLVLIELVGKPLFIRILLGWIVAKQFFNILDQFFVLIHKITFFRALILHELSYDVNAFCPLSCEKTVICLR